MNPEPSPNVVEVRAEKMTAGGSALAREESGRVVFVRGAIPGELVRAAIHTSKRDVAHADVVEIVEPSPERVEPPCPQVERGCGGCDWQHVDVAAQSQQRLAIVTEALSRTGRIADPPVVAGRPMPSNGVRTTLRLAVDADGRTGLRAERSNDVVPTDTCLVAHEGLGDLIRDVTVPGGSEITFRIGAATGRKAAWWTPSSCTPVGLPADVSTGNAAVVHEVVAGRRLRISADSFFQASLDAAEALVEAVGRAVSPFVTALPDGALVLDAYAGVGLFGATVVPERLALLSIEGSRSSCADAEVNLAGRDARVLRCSMEKWRPEPVSLVIADPSRSGLGKQAAARLVATGADTIVLVSCDPVALARDAALLVAAGFSLDRSEVLDLFPHTHHVEVVSTFLRRPG